MWVVAEVRQSAKNAQEVQNECNRMQILILQYNYSHWVDIRVYAALLAFQVCILAASWVALTVGWQMGNLQLHQPTLCIYNYPEIADVFFLGGTKLVGIRLQ